MPLALFIAELLQEYETQDFLTASELPTYAWNETLHQNTTASMMAKVTISLSH